MAPSSSVADEVAALERRIDAVLTRPSTRAAAEFFAAAADIETANTTATGDDDDDDDDVSSSLPKRVQRLVERLKEWDANDPASGDENSNNNNSSNVDTSWYSWSPNKDRPEAHRIAIQAAVLASASSSSSYSSIGESAFLRSFYTWFRTSLEAWARQYDADEDSDGEDNNMMNDDDDDEEQRVLFFQNLQTLGWLPQQQRQQRRRCARRRSSTVLLQRPLTEAIEDTILAKVRSTIMDDFESPDLYQQVLTWTRHVVGGWIAPLVTSSSSSSTTADDDNNDMMMTTETTDNDMPTQQQQQEFDHVTATCYCVTRFDQIFDMVADFPDSLDAVLELKLVLDRTRLHHELGQALRAALIRRLNHPGANTSQIIDVYIATIKVVRLIDPSDRLLAVVAEPVRQYLRRRHDTVRCIITSLTDAATGGDLYQELRRQDAKPLENVTVDSDDEGDAPPSLHWQPQPSLLKPRGTFLQGASSSSSTAGGNSDGSEGDILAMLVSIYGSKELFVNEYRLMLADKLLTNLDYDTDKEVHTLELLKLRFGELSMRNCEVMIKDMDDSKRTNANIHSTLRSTAAPSTYYAAATGNASNNKEKKSDVVDVAMISHIFWPPLQAGGGQQQLKHHPRIQSQLDAFSTEYARLKNPRILNWVDQLGTVELELDVIEENDDDDNDSAAPIETTKTFRCSPIHATLISHFEDQARWTADQLSNETGIPTHIIGKRMSYWVNQRVVRMVTTTSTGGGGGSSPAVYYEITGHEQLLGRSGGGGGEGSHHHADTHHHMMMDDDDHHHGGGGGVAASSAAAQHEEEMTVFESYIVGMLTNLGQLPLERIHNMLKMFCADDAANQVRYNKTPQQLSAFLANLCRQEKLECGPDGMYKLLKK